MRYEFTLTGISEQTILTRPLPTRYRNSIIIITAIKKLKKKKMENRKLWFLYNFT